MRLIFLIDVSGSMKGHKIGAVDDAMDNLLEELRDFALSSEPISISMLLYSQSVTWLQKDDMDIEKFIWNRPECNGMTSLGAACLALDNKLQDSSTETYKIILMSDGCSTDDYDEGIERLDNNEIFRESSRYAIAIGEDADIPSLTRFTADSQKVLHVSDLSDLMQMLTKAVELSGITPQHQVDPSDKFDETDEWN